MENTLQINQKYYVSFYVSLADTTICFAINNIGVLFSTINYGLPASYCQTNPYFTLLPPLNYAHIIDTSIVSDKVNWTRISGSFIADSLYKYLIIGNFFDDAHTSFIQVDSFCNHCGCAYYYVDDVFIGTDSVETIVNIHENNDIYVFPNPASDFINIQSNQIIKPEQTIIRLFSSQGIPVKCTLKYEFLKRVIINTSDIPTGIYFLNINSETFYFSETISIINN
jgi:hypothetical protein